MKIIPYLCFLWFVASAASGCNSNISPAAGNDKMKQDSVVTDAGSETLKTDTNLVQDNRAAVADTTAKMVEVKKAKQKIVAPAKPAPAASNDTTYYYYKDGKVSVKVTAWSNGNRYLLFFDRKGTLTYQLNDKRMSFTITTQLKFKENGSVKSADTHDNPGASMYWYESSTTFSDDNEPQWRTSQRMPQQSLSDGTVAEYWDKNTGQWRKQEVQE